MDRIPKPGECYRHFKNKLYQIITVAEHSETGEKMVVYQALYGTFGAYVRPLSMFTSEVDHEKYPEVMQKYRFERVELRAEAAGGKNAEHGSSAETQDETIVEIQSLEETDRDGSSTAPESDEKIQVSSKNLLAFLDAETYYEKLEVLKERREIFSEEELAAVCESLDIGSGAGTKEAMYRASFNYLEMQSKYDGARLR